MPTHSQQMRSAITRKLTHRDRGFRGIAPFIAVLTFLIAPANMAQTRGASQASGKRHVAPVRNSAAPTGAGLMEPGRHIFSPVVTYDAGGLYSHSVAVADVNGDGKPDLVVANYCPSTGCGNGGISGMVGILLGNGDGTFRTAVSYSSGGVGAQAVAIADVNGDGKPDLLVSNGNPGCGERCNGTVGVLLGNGDGTFRPAVIYGSGAGDAQSVAVADVNGDGKPDLVVANFCTFVTCSDGMVGVLLGNGDGTFQPATIYDSGGSNATSVAVADVNNDGNPDLLVANAYSATVGVLLGNGDGTFRAAATYASGGTLAVAVAVAAADLNGDGKPDVVVTNASGVGVLLGNGDGTFQKVVTYYSGAPGSRSVAIADVNGDGEPDLLVANNYGIGLLVGNGDATFPLPVIYSSGGGPFSVAVTDVNGDGRPDLLVANEFSVGVLLARSTTSTSFISSLNPSVYGQKVTWTAKVTSSRGVTPTGKVQFTWSIYTIGSATLNSSGVATFSRSNLNADTYPLTAVYSGDVNNLGSTSPVLNQVVLETTSAAALNSSPNPSTQGQAVTFTAKISSPTVTPTGPVTFTAGKTVLGTAQLSGGKATLTISSLAVGSTTVTVTYYADSNIAKSSASVIQTVQ
jgi:hypothetical protein